MSTIAAEPTTKQAWRIAARQRRATVDWAAVGRAVTGHLAGWLAELPPTTVVVYLAMAQEPPLTDLAALVGPVGHRWGTTRTWPDGRRLTVHPLDAARERHRYGFDQPVADAPVIPDHDIGIVLVPGLAFDRWGGRLGHGQGHYDRFLAELGPAPRRVGVTAAACVVDERLPTDAFDVPMNVLFTELGMTNVDPSLG